MELSQILRDIGGGPIDALLFFFILFLLRLLLRKEWIAGIVFGLLLGVVFNLNTTTPMVDLPLNILAYSVFAVTLLRFGLLAGIVADAVSSIAFLAGLLDFSAWYAGLAVIPLLVVAGIAVYGFRTSLGGRKVFQFET